jgi:hypothetical protein
MVENVSTDFNNVQSKRNTMFAIIVGIVALGIMATVLAGSQMLNASPDCGRRHNEQRR